MKNKTELEKQVLGVEMYLEDIETSARMIRRYLKRVIELQKQENTKSKKGVDKNEYLQ